MITIVDYRAGNLASVQKALTHLGFESVITEDADAVRQAEKILLPGVGHFSATARLEQTGVRQAIEEAISRGVPFMGICVGMQWLFAGSTEAPDVKGLGCFEGSCVRFETELKVPHVGWNRIVRNYDGDRSHLLRGVERDAFVYYTHSFHAPVVPGVVATTHYGEDFAACVERDNIFGVQFHPEKSSIAGLQMLKNFCEVRA